MPKSVLSDGGDTGPSEQSHCLVLFHFFFNTEITFTKREKMGFSARGIQVMSGSSFVSNA